MREPAVLTHSYLPITHRFCNATFLHVCFDCLASPVADPLPLPILSLLLPSYHLPLLSLPLLSPSPSPPISSPSPPISSPSSHFLYSPLLSSLCSPCGPADPAQRRRGRAGRQIKSADRRLCQPARMTSRLGRMPPRFLGRRSRCCWQSRGRDGVARGPDGLGC